MKKIIILVLMLIMIPAMCFAVEPVIRSDTRTFDPLKGIYNLQGNVFVQLPAHEKLLTITADETTVYLYSMEVHGQGHISLTYESMNFNCDKVDIYHSNTTAYVSGNLNFVDGSTRITADAGSFNWDSKQAVFYGNVTVNGVKQNKDILYDVLNKKIV